MYLLTKYIKSALWGVAVRLSYIQDAWCLKVNSPIEVISQLYLDMTLSRTARHWPSIQSQMITIHTILFYSCKVHFNNISELSLYRSACLTKILHEFLVCVPLLPSC